LQYSEKSEKNSVNLKTNPPAKFSKNGKNRFMNQKSLEEGSSDEANSKNAEEEKSDYIDENFELDETDELFGLGQQNYDKLKQLHPH
jgi:alpha-glucosidase (family GH31 glycosyl hydrolase)